MIRFCIVGAIDRMRRLFRTITDLVGFLCRPFVRQGSTVSGRRRLEWSKTYGDEPGAPADLAVGRLLETPIDGNWVNIPLDQSHLHGEARFERPCDLKRGFGCLSSLKVGAFTYSFSHIGVNVGAIGRYCSIAADVTFGHHEHPVDWLTTSTIAYEQRFMEAFMTLDAAQGYRAHDLPDEKKRQPITIGNDVWIGVAAYVRGGVRLGHGSVIGNHAVVTKDVPPYAIVVGNPARIVRFRFPPEIVERLLDLAWWHFAFRDFAGLDPTRIEGAIEHMQRLIDDGLAPYRPPVTRIVGDGHTILDAAIDSATASNGLEF
jgi:acetyltransferase-like isoleucine patch superfamily enzyme